MPKVVKNLTLDADAVARAERYGKRHKTSLSRLVSDFLARLPDEAHEAEVMANLTPTVRRLVGALSGWDPKKDPIEAYHDHLWEKYMGRKSR